MVTPTRSAHLVESGKPPPRSSRTVASRQVAMPSPLHPHDLQPPSCAIRADQYTVAHRRPMVVADRGALPPPPPVPIASAPAARCGRWRQPLSSSSPLSLGRRRVFLLSPTRYTSRSLCSSMAVERLGRGPVLPESVVWTWPTRRRRLGERGGTATPKPSRTSPAPRPWHPSWCGSQP